MTILSNPKRNGKISGSNASKIVGIGKRPMTKEELSNRQKGDRKTTISDPLLFSEGGETYVSQLLRSRRMRRDVGKDADSSDTLWGDLMERRVVQMILKDNVWLDDMADKTEVHHDPQYAPYWCGSPDLLEKGECVADIKGFQRDRFSRVYEILEECERLDSFIPLKENEKDIYWQLLSNSEVFNTPNAEIIIYCPYDSEREEIKELAEQMLSTTSKWGFQNIRSKYRRLEALKDWLSSQIIAATKTS